MFSPVLLCQSRERLSRECGDVQWCSLGTAPFINKRSEPGFCCLCVWVVVFVELIGCWAHEHVSWWLGSLPLCCWCCWQAVMSSAWLVLLGRRCRHLELCFDQLCSVKWGKRCRSLRSLSFLPMLFGSLCIPPAVLLTSWSLHFPLSPFLSLRWLPLATPSRHQMAKAGGRGDAPISPSLYHLPAQYYHPSPVLILSHVPSFLWPIWELTAFLQTIYLHLSMKVTYLITPHTNMAHLDSL